MTVAEAISRLTRSPGRRFHLDLSIVVGASGRVSDVEWSYYDSEQSKTVSEPSLDALVARLTAPADTVANLDAAGVGDVTG